MTDRRDIWTDAAKNGLILAAVTIAATLLGTLCKTGFLNILIWLAKLIGSIMVLRASMAAFGRRNPSSPTFGHGLRTCLCSSIVCAVWAFVMYSFIFPDIADEAINLVLQQMGDYGQMEEQMTDVLLKVQDNYAQYSSIVSFGWDLLLGLIFSAILSESTRNHDIFVSDGEAGGTK